MTKGTKWKVGGLVALVLGAALALGYFEVQTAFVDEVVDEPLGEAGDVLASGAFHDVSHAGQGTARVVARSDGAVELQLVDFRVDNGPALEMWLVDLDDAVDDDGVKTADRLELGPLKGNIGNQRYPLPDGFDRERHRAVVVWCERFGVNFASAPLAPES